MGNIMFPFGSDHLSRHYISSFPHCGLRYFRLIYQEANLPAHDLLTRSHA